MFTGIVEEIGKVLSIRYGKHSAALTVEAKKVIEDVHLGDSIAVNGVCLTVTAFTKHNFTVDIMGETLRRSTFSNIAAGKKVNLERAMAANGRFGGHMVSGHVDAIGVIRRIQKDDIAWIYEISAPNDALRYIVEKGSITIDGTSLTVVSVDRKGFSVSLIPHTAANTILGEKTTGASVNLETDILARYVEKLLDKENGTVTMDLLHKTGFA